MLISKFSKTQINKLGDKIRNEVGALDNQVLEDLQYFRISHKNALSKVFNELCNLSKKINKKSIVTFRIKRFESIIGKLLRYPEMELSRMWDIGGCRCILETNAQVYKLKDLISENFDVKKIYDYIENPQVEGYKALHLFIKLPSEDRIIEVQLRNRNDHNWATLVEISDLLFDVRLKEFGDNKDLLRFHYLLSRLDEISLKEKFEIAKILKDYNYFDRLSAVFTRNYIHIRKKWFDIETQNGQKYFLIETNKDDIPKIQSFSNFTEAENHYFNVYKNAHNANIVLTHLPYPSYNQISIAYSNYILTFHTFLDDSCLILENLIGESLENKSYRKFFWLYNLYNDIVITHIENVIRELIALREISKQKTKDKKTKNKEKEWVDDLNDVINKRNTKARKFQATLKTKMPTSFIGNLTINQLIKLITYKYRKRLEKTIATYQNSSLNKL